MNFSQDKIHESVEELEKKMIRVIIDRYFECRAFFEKYKNNEDMDHHEKKDEFLRIISQDFFDQFKEHPYIAEENILLDIQEIVNKYHKVILTLKSGGFQFPHSFTRFMDRLKDINILPVRNIDLSELDEYMKAFSNVDSLDDFLTGFFIILKSLSIPLRIREVELLRLLVNPFFLLRDAEGNPRITPPEHIEYVRALGYTKRKLLRIRRAEKFLYDNRICYTNMIIMNPAKFGFYIAQFEYHSTHSEEMKKIEPFVLWDLPFKDRNFAIACVPYANINDFLSPFDYSQLTNWYWATNFQKLTFDKDGPLNGWSEFEVPNFLAKHYRTSNFVKWDLERSYKNEFSENEIEILKNLTKINGLSIKSLEQLSVKLSYGAIKRIVTQFVENGVYQLYPNIVLSEIRELIFLKISCQDKEFSQSIIHNLLSFPVSHVFSNFDENLIIAYIRIPNSSLIRIKDKLHLLSMLLKEKIEIQYELLPSRRLLHRVIKLDKINFTIRDGMAYTIN